MLCRAVFSFSYISDFVRAYPHATASGFCFRRAWSSWHVQVACLHLIVLAICSVFTVISRPTATTCISYIQVLVLRFGADLKEGALVPFRFHGSFHYTALLIGDAATANSPTTTVVLQLSLDPLKLKLCAANRGRCHIMGA